MEDIIPLIIIFLVIFGSGIKKLLQKVAQGMEESRGPSEQGGSSRTRRAPRSTETSSSGRQEGPVRLDRASRERSRGESTGRTSTAAKRRTKETSTKRRTAAQQKRRSSTPDVTSVSEKQQKQKRQKKTKKRRKTGPGRPRRDREQRGEKPQLGDEARRGEGTDEMEEMAERKWAETPPAAAPGRERTSEKPVSGEELEEKIERRAGDSPLKKAIIWTEILGEPVSRRRRGGRLLPHQERNR